MNHFQIAAEHGSAEGQYYMGLMYYSKWRQTANDKILTPCIQRVTVSTRTLKRHCTTFSWLHKEVWGLFIASELDYLLFFTGYILAVYYLAEMHAEGKGVKRSCTLAVEVRMLCLNVYGMFYEILTLVDLRLTSNSNCFNLRTVNAIDSLFSTLCLTLFFYVFIFWCLAHS